MDNDKIIELNLGSGRRIIWNETNQHFSIQYSLDSYCEVGFNMSAKELDELGSFINGLACAK